MTGTSLDGLDVAAVEITGAGLACRARFLAGASAEFGPFRALLRRLADGEPCNAGEITAVAQELANLHITTIRQLVAAAGLRPHVIVLHGQTVFHAPPLSWQLCAPFPVAAALRVPILFDLRLADIAHGGQGAPLTPLADFILFRSSVVSRAIVNLGGFCNVTYLPRTTTADSETLAHVRGGDVCACNHLLNQVAEEVLGVPFDRDGARAMAGRVDEAAARELIELLRAQGREHRSLGNGDEVPSWLPRHARRTASADLARTACESLATVIAESVLTAEEIILAGGGARNQALVQALQQRAARPVRLTDALGVPIQYREAAGFAVLGALTQDRVPITLPQITGVASPAPIAGAWILP